jgi:hypothetical protein
MAALMSLVGMSSGNWIPQKKHAAESSANLMF